MTPPGIRTGGKKRTGSVAGPARRERRVAGAAPRDGSGVRTSSSLGISLTIHAMLLMIMTVALPGPRREVEELVEIAYIKARYGEQIADKVEIRKPDLGPGRAGVATRSAVKKKAPEEPAPPKPVPPAPRPERPRAQAALGDVATPAPAAPEVNVPPPPQKRLTASQKIPLADLARPEMRSPERSELGDVKTAGISSPDVPDVARPANRPTLHNKLAVPDVAVARPADRTPDRETMEDVRGGTLVPSAPSRPGAIVPKGSLETRSGPGGSGALDAGPGAPGGGVTRERSGRRTILDYGDGDGGGGGGALRGRARVPVEPEITPPTRDGDKATDEELADKSVSIGGKGVNLTISGPISGRAIERAVPPAYPEIARTNGWEGAVAVHFTVLANGTVKDNMYVEQASAHHELDKAAMDALRQWKFSALSASEAQVEQWGVLTIIFRLE